MDNIYTKLLGLTGLGAGVLYLLKYNFRKESRDYINEDGKIVWWLFIYSFVLHVLMALFGATLLFLLFDTSLLTEYKEYQLIGSIVGGLVARETLPIGLDLLIEEIEVFAKKRRKRRREED